MMTTLLNFARDLNDFWLNTTRFGLMGVASLSDEELEEDELEPED